MRPRHRSPTRPRSLRAWACTALCLAALLVPSAAAGAEDDEDDDLRRDFDSLRTDHEQLRLDHESLQMNYLDLSQQFEALLQFSQDLQTQLQTAAQAPEPDSAFYIPKRAIEFEEAGLSQNFGDIYTKPFLVDTNNVYIGGYIDLEFTDSQGDDNRFFDQHRLVPYIYADVSDRVKVAAEVEIEHGSEVEVEFAQIDYLLSEAFNFRAGIQLLPLGKFNEVHDSPIQDLTARPLVNRYIIPTTLRDAGVGAFGNITETVSYQATVTNGFKGLDDAGTNVITAEKGLRDAAPQKENDDLGVDPFEQINDEFAYTARVAWEPQLGVEVGGSVLFDHYDEAGNNDLVISAVDVTIDGQAIGFMPDNMELLFEGAHADVERDAFAKTAGVAGDMDGYYAQANFHFEPDFLETFKDKGLIEKEAHFTFVTRYDYVDLDSYEINRTTVGLNFRPNATHTVYKFDYQFNSDDGDFEGDNDDNAFLFSVASYF